MVAFVFPLHGRACWNVISCTSEVVESQQNIGRTAPESLLCVRVGKHGIIPPQTISQVAFHSSVIKKTIISDKAAHCYQLDWLDSAWISNCAASVKSLGLHESLTAQRIICPACFVLIWVHTQSNVKLWDVLQPVMCAHNFRAARLDTAPSSALRYQTGRHVHHRTYLLDSNSVWNQTLDHLSLHSSPPCTF